MTPLPEATPGLTLSPDVMPGSTEFAIRVDAAPEGGRLYFRGTEGCVGKVQWAADRFLVVPIYQNTEHSIFFHLRFWEVNEGENPPRANIDMGVFPGLIVPVVLPLHALDLNTLFLPPTPGRLKSVCMGTPVDPAKVTCFALEIPQSALPQTIWVGLPYVSDQEPEYKVKAQPAVDALGQWRRKDWKSKTRGEDAMVANLRQRADEALEPLDGPFDKYGGWTARQSKATGYFRTEHDGKRWWLIDPEGHPFFSAGIDCIRPDSAGPVAEMKSLFTWLPPEEGEFAEAWSNFDRSRGPSFSFPTANLIRAFGEDWAAKWQGMAGKQLRHWGFNTVANWSAPGLGPRLQMPYVSTLPRFPTTKAKIFRDLPDVFSAEYSRNAAECAQDLAAHANDPFLIGYFLTNEPTWAFGDYNLAEMVLVHPDELVSKQRLIKFLADRYSGDVTQLARAWQHPIQSFDGLRNPLNHAGRLSPKGQIDLKDFTRLLIEEYVRVPAEAARRVDRNHLNLGLRWAWIASDAFYAGSKYCDVFSINCYQMRPDAAEIRKVSQASKLPVIIGEFHAGALDVGLPANALRGVADQHARGQFYSWYMEHGAAIPELVGAHYFQWMDQPVLGRDDGECLNIGLVDVCHRPYEEMVQAARTTNRRLYDIAAGDLPPTTDEPIETPREGF